MAGRMKPQAYYTFDQNRPDQQPDQDRQSLPKRLFQLLRNRYALLALVFVMAGSMILYNTAALQLSSDDRSGVSETTGVSRQQTLSAPRGDILDAAGLPLAYSVMVNTVELSYAGLDVIDLNDMLLDLIQVLEADGLELETTLPDYFRLNHENCDPETGEDIDCGVPEFAKAISIIVDWQTHPNFWNLEDNDSFESKFDDRKVKYDPQAFYDYLLYSVFEIEDPQADGQRYSAEDAYRIMQLRYEIMINGWTFRNGTPIEIAREASDELIALLNEQNYRFPGVLTSVDYERAYSDLAADVSHVLGYVGAISSSQYDTLRLQGYSLDAIVGQAGVEFTAERYLSGQTGIKPYNTWTVAGEEGSYYSESFGKDPVPGSNVKLTLDMSLQSVAVNSLQSVIEQIRSSPNNKNRGDADAGAVVMIDVRTGDILAMASYPDYDPNDFILRADDEAAAERVADYLTNNVTKPMVNRAIQEIYAPGSTFKPATSVAALESGVITPTSNTIRCVGHEEIGDWLWYCLEYPSYGHGNLSLTRAIATSCNMYFYNLGYRTTINQISLWAENLGLGEYTGIDLPGEVKGFRASRETKVLLRNNPEDQIWFPADTCQSAIGQFDNSFTIIQLAVYTAALATGNQVTPHVIDQITSADGVLIADYDYEPVPIGMADSTLEAVRDGMIAAANSSEGTAYRYFRDFPITVAAKTGTAETGFEDRSSSNGLFICYAPADNPQVAIAQIIEKGAWGSNTIGIAKDLLTAYFGLDEVPAEDFARLPGLEDRLAE